MKLSQAPCHLLSSSWRVWRSRSVMQRLRLPCPWFVRRLLFCVKTECDLYHHLLCASLVRRPALSSLSKCSVAGTVGHHAPPYHHPRPLRGASMTCGRLRRGLCDDSETGLALLGRPLACTYLPLETLSDLCLSSWKAASRFNCPRCVGRQEETRNR